MRKKLTATAPHTGEPSRRTVWRNTTECTHRWAANTNYDGRCGNVFFRAGVIYSYGEHFPMARWVKLKDGRVVVLSTTRGYSSSTSSHKSDVRRAIPKGVTVFYVLAVTADERREHLDNLNKIADEALEAWKKAGRARTNKSWLLGQCRSLIADGNTYAEAVGLKERLPDPEGLEAQKAEADVKEAAAEKRRRAARRKQAVIDLAEWDQKLAAWHDGGEWPGNRPMDPDEYTNDRSRLAYLRIKGKALETSMRAAVPLKVALPILAMVRAGRHYNAHESDAPKIILEGFELRAIDPELRTVTIGCHTVAFDEIERLAKKHNL